MPMPILEKSGSCACPVSPTRLPIKIATINSRHRQMVIFMWIPSGCKLYIPDHRNQGHRQGRENMTTEGPDVVYRPDAVHRQYLVVQPQKREIPQTIRLDSAC